MREGASKEITIHTEEPSIVKCVCHFTFFKLFDFNYCYFLSHLQMIEFFYTGTTTLTPDNALPLLRLSALYDIASLRYNMQQKKKGEMNTKRIRREKLKG